MPIKGLSVVVSWWIIMGLEGDRCVEREEKWSFDK